MFQSHSLDGFRLLLVYGLSSGRHGRHPKQTEPMAELRIDLRPPAPHPIS